MKFHVFVVLKSLIHFVLNSLAGSNTAFGAIEDFQTSYMKRDKIGMAISVITVLSGIATASGNPIGLSIALALNLLKTGLNVAKVATEEPEESESDKLEKVIKKALGEYRETNLKAEWNGYEKLSDIFKGNIEMVVKFSEWKESSPEVADFKDKGLKLDTVKQSLFDIVVSRMYDVLMSSNVLLGKVQYEISEVCGEEGVETPKLKDSKWSSSKDQPTISDKEDDEDYAKKCLNLYELYGKMNYYREITFLGHLDSIDDLVGEIKTATILKSLGYQTKREKSKVDSHSYKLLIMDVIKQMNENNKDVFKPLANAFKNVNSRYLINYLYTYPSKYEYLSKYIEKLDFGEERLKEVMFCTKEALSGSCTLKDDVNEQATVRSFKFRSAFVPEGKRLQISYEADDITKGIQKFGPGTLTNMFYDTSTNPVNKFGIKIYNKKDNIRHVTMCTFPKQEENQPEVPLHKAVCTEEEVDITGLLPNVFKTDKLRCGSGKCFQGKPIVVATEETDIAFTAHRTATIDKVEYKFRWGPFFGPLKMEHGCGSIFWDEIKFHQFKSKSMEDKEQLTVKPVTDAESCKGNTILCQDKVIDKSFFLKICKEQELKGYCQEIPIIKGQQINRAITIDLTRIGVYIENDKGKDVSSDLDAISKVPRITSKGGESKMTYDDKVDNCNWFQRDEGAGIGKKEKVNLLRSMKIPKDMLVELYTDYDGKGTMFGPYEGPLTVDRVDGNDEGVGKGSATFIKSLRYVEKAPKE